MSALGKFIGDVSLYNESTVMIESYSSQGALPSNLNNPSTQNTFNIQSSQIDNLRSMTLEVSLTNNGSTSAVIYTPGIISYLQVGLGAGSQLFSETIYAENIVYSFADSSASKTSELALMMGFNEDTYSFAANTIAPAATAVFSIPISCLLTKCSLPLSMIPLTQLRVYWSSNGIATNSNATASDISVSNLNLYITGQKFSPDIKQSLFKQLSSGKAYKFKTYVNKLQVIAQSSTSTSAGSVITGNLTNFSGVYADLSMYLRSYAAVKEQLSGWDYSTLTPADFESTNCNLLGAGRVSIWAGNMSYNQATLVNPYIYWDSPFFSAQSNFNSFNFTDSPAQSHISGLERGLMTINTTYQYQCSNLTTLSNGYDLVCVGYGLAIITMEGEKLTVSTYS